jgi:hypothetical protein
MEMISIDPSRSSQIAQIGHDGRSLCRVLFRRGGLYEYRNLDSEMFAQFQSHPKPGEFFRDHIKGNAVKFPFSKVEGSEFTAPPLEASPAAVDRAASRLYMHSTAPTSHFAPSNEVEKEEAPAPEIENQEVEQVAQKASLLVQNAVTLKVTDPTTQHQASQVLLAIAALRKEVADTFRPMKEAAFKAHRTVCEQEKKHDQPLADAERAVKAQIGNFVAEQNRLAREAEEAARKAEHERAEREALELSQQRAIEDAVALESIGDTVGAQAVLDNPAPMPVRYVAPAPIAPQVAQVSGVSTREDWDFRITDEMAIPREYLLVNESAIRALGKTTKGKARIAGVEFYSKQVVAASRRG